MVESCFRCNINKIWAHIIKYQTKKVVQYMIKRSILIKYHLGPLEANPMEVLCFFLLTIFQHKSGPRAGPEAGPGRPKWVRYFENIKVQDRSHGNFAAIIVGFGAIWTQLVVNRLFGSSTKKYKLDYQLSTNINQYKPI